MGIKEIIIPQDKVFFDLLERESENVLLAAEALKDLIYDFRDVQAKRDRIKELEHRGDEIVHEIYQKLNKTFITPIDHEDISSLASKYDDVLDFIYASANKLALYEIAEATVVMKQFSEIVLHSVEEIDSAFATMRKLSPEIDRRCNEVDRLENEADVLLNESVAALFKGGDLLKIVKLKEIYEVLEEITDKCEDVAYILRDIVMKNT
jgi:predicted phosphate transport protein (TIGR00153 family)